MENNCYVLSTYCFGFPGGSDGKESACNAGDLGSISGLVRSPGGGQGSPVQYSCLENPHGQRSLAGPSPWGCKESDMNEGLSILQHIYYMHISLTLITMLWVQYYIICLISYDVM